MVVAGMATRRVFTAVKWAIGSVTAPSGGRSGLSSMLLGLRLTSQKTERLGGIRGNH